MCSTAASRVIRCARQSTSASQNVVRPTANPMTPGTVAGRREPGSDLGSVFAAAERDEVNAVATIAARRRDEVDIVLAPVRAFDFPDIGFDAGRLQLMNRLHGEARPEA